MANILSLAMKINADASGVVKNLTPAERALENLGKQADRTTSAFDKFAKDSQAAAAAQAGLNARFAELSKLLQDKGLSPAQFAEQWAALSDEVKATAAAYEEGARVTESVRTAEERRTETLQQLARLLEVGAISSETYARAIFNGSEEQKAAAVAERDRLEALRQGQALAEQFATTEEKRAKQLAVVTRLLEQGAISEETAARARAEYSGQNAARAQAEKALADATEDAERRRAAAVREAADAIEKARGDAERAAAEKAAEAERVRSQALAAAARIIQANLTPQERYDQQIQELSDHLREGRLTQEQYNRAAEKAQQELNGTAVAAGKTDKSISALVTNTRILAGIEIGRLFVDGLQALGNVFSDIASRVSSLVTTVNGSIDTLNDFSARTGIGVEKLQGYSLAAKLAGVDTEQFGVAVQKLGVNIGKAAPGDAFDKSLKSINLSVQELRALSPEQQFSAIGGAISQLPTAADRAAAAVRIFGEQGAALAPLFREGAASIEELQARAERLGIIVSEQQVGNVADMNDAFDLVKATVEGIIGQVIGNLAPAVTDVTNQFLRFVEEWSGAQGEGGTGIANAITDVLLEGASYFAGIFDEFVSNFSGIIVSAESVSSTFSSVTQGLLGLSETFRAVFNIFQLAGNALSAALGKLLEAVGGYVSDDLEQYGRELQRQAMIATEQNSRELEDAAARAGQAFGNMLTGGGDANAAGQGAASQYLAGLRAEIARARLPEVKVQTNLGDAQERLAAYLKTAEDGGSKFFQQSVATVEQFQKMAAEGGLTADQIQVMNGFMDDLNGKLDQEIAKRQEAADAAAAQADADQKRIASLLQSNDAAAKIEEDLQAVQREQARVSAELAAAREADNAAQADAAAARQGELDQLQAKLEEQQQALSQGFDQGFQAAFDNVNENINGLIAKSQEFGQAGFDAALRLQEGIAAAQQQAKDGILNAEAYQQEVQRQQELFNAELKHLEDVKKQKEKDDADALERAKQQNDELLRAQEQYQREQQAALEAYQQQQAKAQEEYAKEQQRIFEEQRKAAEAEAKRQEERLRKLNTLGDATVNAQDIRTTEGAALVLNLAAGAQDPRLIQERLQTKLLEIIAGGITQAAGNYFNTPVAIVGYARLTGE